MARSKRSPASEKRERELTFKQHRFVEEYLVDLNGAQAAIRAGYSPKSANKIAHELLDKTGPVAAAVQARMDRRSVRTEITADQVLTEIFRIASADIAQAYNEDGSLKPIHEIPEDVRRAISGVDVEELFEGRGQNREHVGQVKKLRFWDKLRANELLGKHLTLFADRIENLTVDLDKLSNEQLEALAAGAPLRDVVAMARG